MKWILSERFFLQMNKFIITMDSMDKMTLA